MDEFAFPNPDPLHGCGGMTLRDYFAIKMAAAMVSNVANRGSAEFFSREAYKFADAMMEARK